MNISAIDIPVSKQNVVERDFIPSWVEMTVAPQKVVDELNYYILALTYRAHWRLPRSDLHRQAWSNFVGQTCERSKVM